MKKWIVCVAISSLSPLMVLDLPASGRDHGSNCETRETPKIEKRAARIEGAKLDQFDQVSAAPRGGLSTDKALVQVLIYGAAVVEFKPAMQPIPQEVVIHFPSLEDHDKDLFKGEFIGAGALDWVPIRQAEDGSTVNLNSDTITFPGLADPGLRANFGNFSLGAYPTSAEEAKDIRWLWKASNFESGLTLDSGNASTHLVLNGGGAVENCGFIHSATSDPVCLTTPTVMGMSATSRSASEYLVIRFLVDKTQDSIQMNLNTGSRIQTITIESTGTNMIQAEFAGVAYDKIFDIRIRNVSPTLSGREMTAPHLNEMKETMFPSASDAVWDLTSPQCRRLARSSWDCTPCNDHMLQPSCITYFANYRGGLSGANRPLCPIMGYP
jgi:hypothetical protein